MNLKNFFKECHDKEVFKKLSIYIVSSWVLIQVFAVTWEPLGLPKKSITYLIIILLIGFPVNIFLVWKFYLVHLNFRKKKIDSEGNPIKIKLKNSPFHKMYYSFLTIISVLSILSASIIINNNFNTKVNSIIITPTNTVTNNKIAVLKFGNNTGDKKYDIIGKMTADWIIHGITENNVGQVVSPEIVDDYIGQINTSTKLTPLDNERIIKEYFNAGKLISGNFYLNQDKLLFQGTITDSSEDKQLISFKLIECDSDSPLECIEKLKQLILGFLITEDDKKMNLQNGFPPKYEAYKYLFDAKANISNPKLYVYLLNKSIESDSTYFEPKVLRLAHYYNIEDFKKSDSLRKLITPTSFTNNRQRNLLNMYKALLNGSNNKVYYYLKKEYNIAPFDLLSNSSNMVIALQYVNKPEDVTSIFNEISTKGMDIENCVYCEYRIYVKALADIELKKYESAIELLEKITNKLNNNYLRKPLFSAYIRSNNTKKIDSLIQKLDLLIPIEDLQELYLHIGKEYLRLGFTIKATFYFEKLIETYNKYDENINLSLAYFYNQNYMNAEIHLSKILKKDSSNISLLSKLASCQYKNGKIKEARKTTSKLKLLKVNYQYGAIDYALAQYFAILENKKKVIEHLLKSVSQGHLFTPLSFQNDPLFIAFYKDESFKNILKFWH